MRLPNWKFKNAEDEREENARKLHEAAWPDMFANLQSAYSELTNAQFELERRTAEIAETRDLFQQVVSSMSEALFLTDRSGRVIRANPAAAALLECPETSILGRPLTAVCGSEEIPATPWKLMELAPTGRLTNLEVDVYTMTGMTIPVSFSLGLMHDKQNKITGLLAVARDMREHRSLINSLVAARTRFQELLEFAPDAVVLANQDGRIVLVNSQTEDLFGYKRDELLGQSVDMLVPARLRGQQREEVYVNDDSLLELDEALLSTNATDSIDQVEFYVVDRSGREFPAEITRRQIETEDGIMVMSLIRDVTERRRIAAALRESEERYRNVAETASDVILTVDDDGAIQFVNSSVEDVFGYKPAEVLGQQLSVLMPDYLERIEKAIIPSGNGSTGPRRRSRSGFELTGINKDGHQLPVEATFSEFIKDGRPSYTGIVRDISDRRKAEAALQEAAVVQQTIVDFAGYAIILTRPDGTITTFNPAAERMLGYRAIDILGNPVTEIIRDQQQLSERADIFSEDLVEIIDPGFEAIVAKACHNLPNEYEWNFTRADGSTIPVMLSMTALRDPDGNITGFIGIASDITKRKRIDEERAEGLRREQEARRVAEEANRLKDDFLAMISHELRAPLTAILGWAQMLRSGSLDRTSAERALVTIERNAKSQAHLVGDLLDASRIATGKLSLEVRPVELMSIVEAAVDAVRPSVEAKNLRMQIVLEPWVGPFNGDAERLKQIVWNLLSNAIKFTPAGGLIEVRLERLENKALLIVSDTGQGIAPEFLPRIFDRFRQADSSSRRQQGGLGLGLAIVKHLVELHGGAIYAYSRGVGQGADFMITLPLAVQGEGEEPGAGWHLPEGQSETRSTTLRGARVLVVEDDHDTREILSVMLTRYGTEVRTAASAAEAVEIFSNWKPDVLVSDIGMPVEDGYSLIKRIREMPEEDGGQVPAIALTAFAGVQDKELALAAGFQVHLSKPVEPVALAKAVARILGRSDEGITL
ncbi:MAG: PAS domain S-box protein [Acidobacteriota bacterium]|nr:MAG: PAS domain S-box protein [Acidobacteriota bacterium]